MSERLFREQLGERIRIRRQTVGLTRQEVVDLAGDIGKRTYDNAERGEHMPSAFTLHRIALALGCLVDELLPQETLDWRHR